MKTKRDTILHVIPTMQGGGAERQLTYLSRGLSADGWDVHVAYLRDGINSDRLLSSGATIHRLASSNPYDPGLLIQLSSLVRRVRPSIVQSWLPQMDILTGLITLGSSLQWVISERASVAAYKRSIRSWIRRVLGMGASAVISNSEAGDAYWKGNRFHQKSRFVVPNSIPIAEIDSVHPIDDASAGLSLGDELILFVGRLAPQKNIQTLVSAVGQVCSRRNAVAVICGEGPLREAVMRQIAALPECTKVRLIGYVDSPWAWMKRANVLVSPSHFEGRPNTVLEAMACRCAVVVSDIPEHREFLGSEEAVFTNPNDVGHIASSIEDVLCHPNVERLRKARVLAEAWSLEAMAKQYAACYESILRRRESGMRTNATGAIEG